VERGPSNPNTEKGDPTKKENYRTVSCLSVASKVLEKIVCDQVTHYKEIHGLLPENQHGFCSKRSTMTALSSMQQEWIENSENKLKTGILLVSGIYLQLMTPCAHPYFVRN
jgi:hypothetical protein